MRSSSLAMFALLGSISVLSFGAGCAAPVSAEQNAGTAEELSTASSGHLSQDLVCAAVSAAENNDQADGLTTIPESKLRGDALRDFKEFQKHMLPDYPSQAFELPVKLGTKTYTFIMVIENNDGGGAMGVYRTDGSVVATDEYSESESNPWSSPADKCPDSN
jgi:hypothetical protein